VPCWDAQGGEDFFGFGGQGVGGGEVVAVEVDGDLLTLKPKTFSPPSTSHSYLLCPIDKFP